jgi:hypothetical protein
MDPQIRIRTKMSRIRNTVKKAGIYSYTGDDPGLDGGETFGLK